MPKLRDLCYWKGAGNSGNKEIEPDFHLLLLVTTQLILPMPVYSRIADSGYLDQSAATHVHVEKI